MFGVGSTEILIIFVVALLLFGGKRMPELARTLGKAVREFRAIVYQATDFKEEKEIGKELNSLKKAVEDFKQDTVNTLNDEKAAYKQPEQPKSEPEDDFQYPPPGEPAEKQND